MKTRAGFTLLETMVSLVIFSAIGASLVMATLAGQTTGREVNDESSSNHSLRAISRALTDELRASSDAQITVAHTAGQNDTLRFQQPIQVGTTLSWGVHDPTLGQTEADQNRAGWSLRYTVETVVSHGVTSRRLLRQVLDQAQNVHSQRVVLSRLRSGSSTPPGFTVNKVGATWQVALSTDARTAQAEGIQEVFHVQARNH